MIDIKYTDSSGVLGVTLKGHADFRLKEGDPICAMATGLTYTLAQNIKDERLGLKGRPKIHFNEGDLCVKCRPKDKHRKQFKLIFDVICKGYKLLAANYPDNVRYHPQG